MAETMIKAENASGGPAGSQAFEKFEKQVLASTFNLLSRWLTLPPEAFLEVAEPLFVACVGLNVALERGGAVGVMILGRGGAPEGETPSGDIPLNLGDCEELFEGLLGFFNLPLKGRLALLAGIEPAFHDLFGRFGEEGVVIDQAEGDLLSLILNGTHGI